MIRFFLIAENHRFGHNDSNSLRSSLCRETFLLSGQIEFDRLGSIRQDRDQEFPLCLKQRIAKV